MVAVWQGVCCRPDRASHRLLYAKKGACFRRADQRRLRGLEDKLCARPASQLHPEPRARLHRHMREIPEKEECYRASSAIRQKVAGPGVPKCRFRFFRYVALQILGMLKYVVRRGKELVKQAFVATGNEENEYGKAMVPRQSPFRSSSRKARQDKARQGKAVDSNARQRKAWQGKEGRGKA